MTISRTPEKEPRTASAAGVAERRIGDLAVSAIGLGAMPLSIHERPDEHDALAVLHAALDAGVTLIDTADTYCAGPHEIGHNERLIARALAERERSDVVVATKGGLERHADGSWPMRGDPAYLTNACEASLRALGVERIDLYQLHAPDPATPFAESVGALRRLQEAGKIRHIGVSNVSIRQLREAETVAPIASVQNYFNLFSRIDMRSGVLDHCRRNGIAYLAYGPLGGNGQGEAMGQCEALRRVSARCGAPPYQVALAWLLAIDPELIPIPGTRSIHRARENAAAMRLALDTSALEELAQIRPAPAEG
jgi:aryl-alcohol dehydrogenase-like predicted oxidoreductase